MKIKSLACVGVLAIVAAGCSIPRAPDTAHFYTQEAIVTNTCMRPIEQMPVELRLQLSPTTGYSPFTVAAWCYARQMRSVVSMLNYPHAALVNRYANHLVDLSEARDNGKIDTQTALISYKQTTDLFKQAISSADQQIEAAAFREIGSRVAGFALAMAAVAAEQQRQQQANRPVVCRLTGVYVMNTVTCM